MVNVTIKLCSHDACTKLPTFNAEGRRTAVFCNQHVEDGMVDIHSTRCSHESCTKQPYFNVERSKTAEYCKQHAHDDMVNVVSRNRCSHDSCKKTPSFDVKGSKTRMYFKKSAEGGMVNVHIWCLPNVRRRAVLGRGVPNNAETTACTRPNANFLDDLRVNVQK